MAYSETAQIVSIVSGATFSSGDLYKLVDLNGSGQAVLGFTTGNILPTGSLYGYTSTTSAGEAVPVAIGGIAKVQMAASTLAAGDFIASSTAGLGIAPTTDAYTCGQIVSGSSGAAGRIATVRLFSGPLSTP